MQETNLLQGTLVTGVWDIVPYDKYMACSSPCHQYITFEVLIPQ